MVAYYLPLVETSEAIDLSGFRIVPCSDDCAASKLLPKDIFGDTGSFIEVDGFNSGDPFDAVADARVYEALERIKFGYFLHSPSYRGCIPGFVSNETFECFRIVEKSADASVEHKAEVSNGMFTFSQSLSSYYRSRASLRLRAIQVSASCLSLVDLLSAGVNDEQRLTAMKLFNRCWCSQSIHSHFEAALWAKVSTEVLIKAHGQVVSKKNFADRFADRVLAHIRDGAQSSDTVKYLADLVLCRETAFRTAISENLDLLKGARNRISHDGLIDPEHVTVPFYLVWFPLFWMILVCPDRIGEKECVRLALFVGLLGFPVKDWQKIEWRLIRCSKTHLYMYDENARLLPKHLADGGVGLAALDLRKKAIANWLACAPD
ncbi:hypothetical protein [Stenotrophomonas indicatrix]|uniref:hypothetical protein n=1 Tax=Stenotrophomonas indicatrix TaxID=2045451 RepID=UPI00289EA906|nr:hypothetical protein [Stenotrophomonas indicatrix]